MKLYFDIETTGLSATNNSLTVLGALRGSEFVQLVAGKNLHEQAVRELFENVSELVTFNGRRFDLPFVLSAFPGLSVSAGHKDLMFLGWDVGLKGGLKSLEVQLGLSRKTDVKNGYEAVILWQKHLSGCSKSLDRLLLYNKEDVLNLPVLEEKLEQLWRQKHSEKTAQIPVP